MDFFIFIVPAHYMKARQKYEHTRKPVVVGANPIQASVDWDNPALSSGKRHHAAGENPRSCPAAGAEARNTGAYR